MKNILLLFILIGSSSLLKAQKDIWSGSYAVYAMEDSINAIDTLVIAKTNDVKTDDVTAKYESDLKRWVITSKNDAYKDTTIARRFLFNLNEEDNEYEEFGWTALHESGKINCMDGGHFFICQTAPNTTITFNKEESYFTKTGIVGIWLHFGLVELRKLD